jgi:protein involved in ribonucleotide reduction
MFLNPMLYQDIAHATSRNEPAVFCFDSVADALRHFVSTTGVKAERLPTAKESKEIKEEIASLPPIDFLSTTMNDAANAVIQSAYAQQRQNAARIAAAAQDSINRWLDEVKVELK